MKIGKDTYLGFFENKRPHHLGKLFLDHTWFIGTFKNGFPNGHFCMASLTKERYARTRCKIHLSGVEEEKKSHVLKDEKIYVHAQAKKFFSTMTHDLRRSVNEAGCFEGDSAQGVFIGKGCMYEGPFSENYTFGDGAILIGKSYFVGSAINGHVIQLLGDNIIVGQYEKGRPVGVRAVMPFVGSQYKLTEKEEKSNNNNQPPTSKT